MIDTDKYEGHLASEGQTWAWSKWMLKNAESKEQMDATSELLADAPLLLAEVKQFHAFDEYMRMLRNGQIDVDDICDVWDEIRKEREE
jgi:hypothetical protein|tara:strand:- start:401 stop:664 length:264 start_codon:yes stop_codon:yes gene_type:complete